jgi:hypothetical protein
MNLSIRHVGCYGQGKSGFLVWGSDQDILRVGITCAFHSLWEWRPAAIIAARGRSTKAQFMTVESIFHDATMKLPGWSAILRQEHVPCPFHLSCLNPDPHLPNIF